MYASASGRGSTPAKKVTVPEIRARKIRRTEAQAGGPRASSAPMMPLPPLAMVTAYDFTMARLVDEAGADLVLVGDSLGMVFQGLGNTLSVTLEDMCYHGRAVAR